MILYYILVAWFAFCIGFVFSYHPTGQQIYYTFLQYLDTYLPKKEKEKEKIKDDVFPDRF